MDDINSGVGVLDKAAHILDALESGPLTLAGLVSATGLARPTAHRLAIALEHHRFVTRDLSGRFVLGPRFSELAGAAGEDRLTASASPVLIALRDATKESAQLYRRQGDHRICVAAAERMTGLRDTVPVGSTLTMQAGSAAQILLAWEEADRLHRGLKVPGLPQLIYRQCAEGAGRSRLASENREWLRYLHQFAARMEKSLQQFRFQVRLNDSLELLGEFTVTQ